MIGNLKRKQTTTKNQKCEWFSNKHERHWLDQFRPLRKENDPLTKSANEQNKIIQKQNTVWMLIWVFFVWPVRWIACKMNNLLFFSFRIIVKFQLKTPIFIQIIRNFKFRIEWFTKLLLFVPILFVANLTKEKIPLHGFRHRSRICKFI